MIGSPRTPRQMIQVQVPKTPASSKLLGKVRANNVDQVRRILENNPFEHLRELNADNYFQESVTHEAWDVAIFFIGCATKDMLDVFLGNVRGVEAMRALPNDELDDFIFTCAKKGANVSRVMEVFRGRAIPQCLRMQAHDNWCTLCVTPGEYLLPSIIINSGFLRHELCDRVDCSCRSCN